MIVFFAADSFGGIGQLVDRLQKKAQEIDRPPDWVFHVGSFGAWPDPKHTDRATRESGVVTDFHEYYLGNRSLPYPILFAPGRHEDHRWLDLMWQKGYFELIPNLHRMPNGFARTLDVANTRLSVLTLGGVFSPVIYRGDKKRKRSWAHYTKRDVEKACSAGPVDLFLCTEAGYGTQIGQHRSQAAGLNNICFATRPALMVHGHYNVNSWYVNSVTKTRCLSLGYGSVVAFQWCPDQPLFKLIG